MRSRNVLAAGLAPPSRILTLILDRTAKTIIFWYPARDITAGTPHFAHKPLFTAFGPNDDGRFGAVTPDAAAMRRSGFAKAVDKTKPDTLFVDAEWHSGFLGKESWNL